MRWFTREEVGLALAGRSARLVIPPGISISYYLIERWFARAATFAGPPTATRRTHYHSETGHSKLA